MTDFASAAVLLFSGLIVGYLVATLIESFFHQRVSDAPQRTVRAWQRFPRVCAPLLRANYSHHVIHHRRTFRTDHVTQFASEEERVALDAQLAALGKHGRLIRNAGYAVRLEGSGALAFIAPFIPPSIAACVWLDPAFAAGFVVALAVSPALNYFVHPYLHMPRAEALRSAPMPLKWFIATAYFEKLVQHHFVHHRYVACNYNLLMGGDRIREWLRRVLGGADADPRKSIVRSPTPAGLAEMKRIGLINF